MTPEEFSERMKEIYKDNYDPARTHVRADNLIIELLKQLGYGEGAEIYEDAVRWFE